MHIRTAPTLAAVIFAGLMIGCGAKSTTDQALTTDIQSKLYADQTTKAANIGVAVKDGTVTLSGDVPNSDVELQAMKIANATPGVKSVSDQMKVNGTAASNAAPNSGPNPASNTPQTAVSSPPPPPPESAPPPRESSPAPVTATPAPAPERTTVTIPAGERVTVRMIDSINSAQNTEGQVFRASLDAPLISRGRVVVPAGAPVSVVLTSARSAGRIKGSSELEVRLSRLEYRGHSYPLNSSTVQEAGKARGKQTAVRTGIGAAAGAVIGAIAGGGKGAAIGSAAGGGAGLGYNLFTHGQQVKIPSESILTFRLEAPLTIEERH
jgi:hypothetical protein